MPELDNDLIYAIFAGIGISAIAGPLGCFMVWRRMAYFGDSLAHSALLGVALGLLLGFNITIGIIIACIIFAILLVILQNESSESTDTLLGILSHSLLAIGLIVVGFAGEEDVEMHDYLFGDILAITKDSLIWIYSIALASFYVLLKIWRNLVATTVHEELAFAEGVNIRNTRLAYIMIIALVTAVAMQIIGILLVTSILIIPAATVRRFSRSPEKMAIMASFLGMAEITVGTLIADKWDIASGPAIVTTAASVYFLTVFKKSNI